MTFLAAWGAVCTPDIRHKSDPSVWNPSELTKQVRSLLQNECRAGQVAAASWTSDRKACMALHIEVGGTSVLVGQHP